MITIFLEEGLFVGSKIYAIGVKNKNIVDGISFAIYINKELTQADPEFGGPIK